MPTQIYSKINNIQEQNKIIKIFKKIIKIRVI